MPFDEQQGGQDPVEGFLQRRAERRVREEAAKQGVPDDLAGYVYKRESGKRGDVLGMSRLSKKGAVGPMQLMPGTAAELGVDPYDFDQNIEGGVRYLKQQLDTFRDKKKALAAYNAGPGRVREAGGVPRIRETQEYVRGYAGQSSSGDPVSEWLSKRQKAAPVAAPADEGQVVRHPREYVGPEPATAADRANKNNYTRPHSTGPLSAVRNKRGEPYRESESYRELVDANPVNREWKPGMVYDLATSKLIPEAQASWNRGEGPQIQPAPDPNFRPKASSGDVFTRATRDQAVRDISDRAVIGETLNIRPAGGNTAVLQEQLNAINRLVGPRGRALQRQQQEHEARPYLERKARELYEGVAHGGQAVQEAGQRAAGAVLGGARSLATAAPYETVDIRSDEGKAAQEATAQEIANFAAITPDSYTREVGAALPVAAGAVLAARAGGLPALAGFNASLEDWQNPGQSATRTVLNTVVPIAGAKLVGAAARPIVGRIPSPTGRAAAQLGSEIVGGATTNAAQSAGEQAVFEGEVDPEKVLKSAIVGGALGAVTESATARDASNAKRAEYLADKAARQEKAGDGSQTPEIEAMPQPEAVLGDPESYRTQEFAPVRPEQMRAGQQQPKTPEAVPQNLRAAADDGRAAVAEDQVEAVPKSLSRPSTAEMLGEQRPEAPADMVGDWLARRDAGDVPERAMSQSTPDAAESPQAVETAQQLRTGAETPAAVGEPAKPRTVSHPDPKLDGKEIIRETGDGRVIIANSNNKTGISVVKDRTETVPKAAAESVPGSPQPAGAAAYREAVRTYLQRRKTKEARATEAETQRQQAEALRQVNLDPNNPLVQHLRNLTPEGLAGELAALGEDPVPYLGKPELMQKAYLKALADYQPDLRKDLLDDAQKAVRGRAVEKLGGDEAFAQKILQDADEAIRAPRAGKETDYLNSWQKLQDAGLTARELDALRDSLPRPEPKFIADARKRVETYKQGQQLGGGQQIVDYVLVKGYDVYRAGMDFAAWAKQVVEELGESARPHLERLWNRIEATESRRGALPDTMRRIEAQRAVRDVSARKLAEMNEGDLRRLGRALGVEMPESIGAPAERQADLAQTLADLSSAMHKLGAPTVARAKEMADNAHGFWLAGGTRTPLRSAAKTLGKLTTNELLALKQAVPVTEDRPLGSARSVSFTEEAAGRDPQVLADAVDRLTAPKRAAQKISELQTEEAQRQSAIEAQKRAEMEGRPEASKVVSIDEARLARLLAASEKAKPQFVLDAEQRLKETVSGRRAGSGAEALTDLAIVAGHRVYRAGMDASAWAREVVKQAGEEVRPHLEAVWQNLQKSFSVGAIPESSGGTVLGSGFGGLQSSGKKPLPPLPSPPPVIGQKPPARTPVLETVSALRKAGLLTGLKTHIRNVGGTAVFQGVEEFARVPGAMMDLALSAVTKQRGLTGANAPAVGRAAYEAATKGVREAWEILKKGAPADDLERLQLHPETRSGSRILDGYINGVFRLMAAEDRVFRTFAMRRSLEDRARAMALTEVRQGKLKRDDVGARTKEIVASPPEDMAADAILDAEISTFNNMNKLSDAVGDFRRKLSPESQFAMNLVLPFDRTPTNVIARTLEYSPLGFAGNARQVAKAITKKSFTAEDQRAFSQKFGRASVGSGLIWLGYTLASKGLMTGMRSDQEADRERDELAGRPPAAILNPLTNTWHQIGVFTPVGSLLAVGASFYKAQNIAGKDTSPLESAVKTGGQIVLEQPLLHTTKDISEGLKQPGRLKSTAGRVAGSFVPTIVSDAAAALDDRQREARGFTPQIQKRIPFLRESLPAATDVFGGPLEFRRTDFFDPTQTRKARERTQPFERELVRLGVGVGPLKPRPKESADDLNDRRAEFGDDYRSYGEMLIDDTAYQDSEPELQREALRVLSERLRRRTSMDYLTPASLLTGAARELQRKRPDGE